MTTSQAGEAARHLGDDTDPSDLGPDLTNCDREPIHVPGAIQPHGILLVADAETRRVVGGAGRVEERFGDAWIGRSLSDLLGADAVRVLPDASVDEMAVLGPVAGGTVMLDAVARRRGGHWLVQLEPRLETRDGSASLLAWLDRVGSALERAPDLKGLCERAAAIFRELTGFDRVMIYRFLDDDAGVVVAEAREAGFGSFLNHHFPASDIPRQARALYIRNRVRVIPDVDYQPAPLRPAELRSLDLSDVDLRSVSPIHVQYLRNMGVAASASVSIVKDGVLWGLVACHNSSPRGLGFRQRLACQAMAGSLARQIRAKEEAEDYRERLRLRGAEDALLSRLGAESVDKMLADGGDDVRRLLDADGFAVLMDRDLRVFGHCPDEIDIRNVASFVRRSGAGAVVHTHALATRMPDARAFQDVASGLVGLVLSTEDPAVLLWFRAERITVVNWAGDPHKGAAQPGGDLTPRASFETWKEEVRGRARAWSLPEIDTAQRLKRAFQEARQTRRIRDLNRELSLTIAEKDALLTQKDHLIKEVNHRVQNSLQLVSAFLSMQARAEGNEALTRSLAEAQRRLSAVALVHRRLYSDDTVSTVDLGRYLEDLVADVKTSMGPDWAEHIKTDLAPILVPTDSAVNIGLILTELIINANKYAYGGGAGPVAVTLEQVRNRYRLIVADHGGGKAQTRTGFGTRMMAAMVDRLGGTLEETGNDPGLRVIFTAPIDPYTTGNA